MSDRPTPRVIYDITATLETLSPLHVGTGQFREIRTVEGKEGANQRPEVATIVRDASNAPYLPGTTIKGLLRQIGETQSESIDIARLFGVIKDDGKGAPGRVTVFGAKRSGSAPAVPDAPFVKGAEDDLGAGVFVAARTKIDPETGTADDHKLFHQEMVAPKTQFELRLRIDARGDVDVTELSDQELALHDIQGERATRSNRDARNDAESILDDLLAALQMLCSEDGQSIGKGYSDGFGRVRLMPNTLEIRGRALGRDGSLEKLAPTQKWKAPQASAAARVLRLICDGPFLVIDASKTPKAGENPDGAQPHIAAQSWSTKLPMLLGSSVSGALRARARWLAMCKALRNGADKDAIGKIDPDDMHLDNRSKIKSLTSVQRLFGVTGFRGRLSITRLRVHEAAPWDVTSVKLDRFTGGPIDNALYKTRSFLGVKLDLGLAIEERPANLSYENRKSDQDLFDALIADIQANGLTLGHGGNKGFGWFRYEESRP